MKQWIPIMLLAVTILFSNCRQKHDLMSDDKVDIAQACEYYGDRKDTSVIKLLLRKSLDPRLQTNILDKGHSVNYSRLTALRRISGLSMGREIMQFGPDTAATLFYVNWAIKKGYIKDLKDADIEYEK